MFRFSNFKAAANESFNHIGKRIHHYITKHPYEIVCVSAAVLIGPAPTAVASYWLKKRYFPARISLPTLVASGVIGLAAVSYFSKETVACNLAAAQITKALSGKETETTVTAVASTPYISPWHWRIMDQTCKLQGKVAERVEHKEDLVTISFSNDTKKTVAEPSRAPTEPRTFFPALSR